MEEEGADAQVSSGIVVPSTPHQYQMVDEYSEARSRTYIESIEEVITELTKSKRAGGKGCLYNSDTLERQTGVGI